MNAVTGIILAVTGFFMMLSPKIFFEITESWKSNTSGEPSSLFVFFTRLGGVALILIGIAGIISG